VLAGIAAAHSEGIVHCDLKPANVIVTHPRPDRPLVKVVDFGIARGVNGAMEAADGLVRGTAAYMAPEQALDGEVDARSDLYSAAAMLFEMLAGCPAFIGEDPTQILSRVLLGQHLHLRDVSPSVPAALGDVVDRGLSRDPKDRPATARDLAQALEPFVSRASGLSIGPTWGVSCRPIALRRVAAHERLILDHPTPSLAAAQGEIAYLASRSRPAQPKPLSEAPPRRRASHVKLASGLAICVGLAMTMWSLIC
jgi:serine/threonine-protein kinase